MPRLCLLGLILVGFLLVRSLAETNPPELVTHHHQTQSSVRREADPPVSGESDIGKEEEASVEAAEAPSSRRLGNHRSDKSVAGGGVIIGGLVTAILAAVVCYIRVTRKRNSVL